MPSIEADGEPEIVRQCGDFQNEAQGREWFDLQTNQAKEAGMTFARYTIHPDIAGLILFEAWRRQPKHQGEPRFALTTEPPSPACKQVQQEGRGQ